MNKFIYKYLGRSLDMHTGFYKHELKRSDGKIIFVSKNRIRQLSKEKRLIGY